MRGARRSRHGGGTTAAELRPGGPDVAHEPASVLGYEDGGVRTVADGFEVHAFIGLGRPAFVLIVAAD
jgi:hypothetical protein